MTCSRIILITHNNNFPHVSQYNEKWKISQESEEMGNPKASMGWTYVVSLYSVVRAEIKLLGPQERRPTLFKIIKSSFTVWKWVVIYIQCG